MSATRVFCAQLVVSKRNFFLTYILTSGFWYLALFPGRLGFDYSEAIRIMKKGESTDWWTALFWRFLQITSFNGRSIALSSLLCLIALGFSLYYLVESLPGRRDVNRISLLLVSCLPLYGAFGVNVSHDVFQVAGILIFVGYQFRFAKQNYVFSVSDKIAIILAVLMVLTTHYGLPIIALNLLLLIINRSFKTALTLFVTTVLISLLSPIGIERVPTYGPILPIMADLKCIAQHPEADISETEWIFLESLAPRTEWNQQATCSFIDYSLGTLKSVDLVDVRMSTELVSNYLKIGAKNAAIVAMAHFQRASVALPPPFFFGPPNQVTRDPDVPIGQGTNTALQSKPGVLHPSIDESSVNNKINLLWPLEMLAQASIFVVNQATWFWGWGGLWLWPIVLFLAFRYINQGIGLRLKIFSNIVLLHSLLLILSAPLPRYVMATILLGVLLTINMTVNSYLKIAKNFLNKQNL
jgi:hypothetical protein